MKKLLVPKLSYVQVIFYHCHSGSVSLDPPSAILSNSRIYESSCLKHPPDIQVVESGMFLARAVLPLFPSVQRLRTQSTFLVNLLNPVNQNMTVIFFLHKMVCVKSTAACLKEVRGIPITHVRWSVLIAILFTEYLYISPLRIYTHYDNNCLK